jgi:hypothetical protein
LQSTLVLILEVKARADKEIVLVVSLAAGRCG